MYKRKQTIENHFNEMIQNEEEKYLVSKWNFIKENSTKQMRYSYGNFPTFSDHDASHSRSILFAIERLLGEECIENLSPSDSFLLLVSAYIHDIGMALPHDQLLEVLKGSNFSNFLKKVQLSDTLDQLIEFVEKMKSKDFQDGNKFFEAYHSICLLIQDFLRRDHFIIPPQWKKIMSNLLNSRHKQLIISICECHGKNIEALFDLPLVTTGFVHDDCHPRLIAALLRIGDLLDMDNGRFPGWFKDSISTGSIPELSVYNYWKHESIKHILITKERIEINSSINVNEHDNYAIASLTGEWFQYLKNEFSFLRDHWIEISCGELGNFPQVLDLRIDVNGESYDYSESNIKALIPVEELETLLEGSNIYENKYVGLRELLQNAIDATLLKYWKDETDRNLNLLQKNKSELEEEYTPFIFDGEKKYSIDIRLIKTKGDQIVIRIQDQGIGITKEDAYAMSKIGTSKRDNKRLKVLMDTIPSWLSPAGYFGLGIQSVFQLTDKITYYSRTSEGAKTFIFHSVPGSKRVVEIQNHVPSRILQTMGTVAEITIDASKYVSQQDYLYYDMDFNENDNKIDSIFQELKLALFDLKKRYTSHYFRIMYYVHDENIEDESKNKEIYFFTELHPNKYYDSSKILGAVDLENKDICFSKKGTATYWDKKNNIMYTLHLHSLVRHEENTNLLDEKYEKRLSIAFKYYPVDNDENVIKAKNDLHEYIDMEINILDKDTQKYLNIDRKYIKPSWLESIDLRIIENNILKRWFQYILERGEGILESQYVPALMFSLFKDKSHDELLELIQRLNCSEILELTLGNVKNEAKTLKDLLTGNMNDCVQAMNIYSDFFKGNIKNGLSFLPPQGEREKELANYDDRILIPRIPGLEREIFELSCILFTYDFGLVRTLNNQYTTMYLKYI